MPDIKKHKASTLIEERGKDRKIIKAYKKVMKNIEKENGDIHRIIKFCKKIV